MIKGFSVTQVLQSFGVTFDASNNVGIGAVSSGYKLHVNGATYSAGDGSSVSYYLPSGRAMRALGSGGTWFFDVGSTGSSGNFVWRSSNNFNTHLTLDSSANLILGNASVATTATNGFLYITGCAGQPTGTPTSYTGRVPLVVDTTNHKLYFYSGGAWRDAGP